MSNTENLKQLIARKKSELSDLREKMIARRYGKSREMEPDDVRERRMMSDPNCWEGLTKS